MSWRAQIANGYPWQPIVFVAVMLALVIAALLGMLIAQPAERAVIDHGTVATGHAIAYRDHDDGNLGGGVPYTFYRANIVWTDEQGDAREEKELDISVHEYAVIGDGSGRDVEIRYIGDRAVIVDDIQNLIRDESDGPLVLGLLVVVALLGVYHWRRRLREWRAPKPEPW